MYCYRCGQQNPDDAKFCTECNEPLCVLGKKTSRIAIMSCICASLALILSILFSGMLDILSWEFERFECLGTGLFVFYILLSVLATTLAVVAFVVIGYNRKKLKGVGLAVSGIIIILLSAGFVMPVLGRADSPYVLRMRCAHQMERLGHALTLYAESNDGFLPSASKWCDLLLEIGTVNRKDFVCPGAKDKRLCNYSINKNLEGIKLLDAHPRTVLLFECEASWNKSGGSEDLTFENHLGGCNILYVCGHTKFIYHRDDVKKLRWKP